MPVDFKKIDVSSSTTEANDDALTILNNKKELQGLKSQMKNDLKTKTYTNMSKLGDSDLKIALDLIVDKPTKVRLGRMTSVGGYKAVGIIQALLIQCCSKNDKLQKFAGKQVYTKMNKKTGVDLDYGLITALTAKQLFDTRKASGDEGFDGVFSKEWFDKLISLSKGGDDSNEGVQNNVSTAPVEVTELLTPDKLIEDLKLKYLPGKPEYPAKKFEKMKENKENLLRGSVEYWKEYLKNFVSNSKNEQLKNLSDVKVLSTGDMHLDQIERINGQLRFTDMDEAGTHSALDDIMRGAASIGLSFGEAYVDIFIGKLSGLLGDKIKQSSLKSDNIKPFTFGGNYSKTFPFFDVDAKFIIDSKKEKKLSSDESKTLSPLFLGVGTIVDAKKGPSGGVGSYGKEKITIICKDKNNGGNLRILELKEQDADQKSSLAQKSQVCNVINGVNCMNTVSFDNKDYTVKELFNNYDKIEPSKESDDQKKMEYVTFLAESIYRLQSSNSEGLKAIKKNFEQSKSDIIAGAKSYSNLIKKSSTKLQPPVVERKVDKKLTKEELFINNSDWKKIIGNMSVSKGFIGEYVIKQVSGLSANDTGTYMITKGNKDLVFIRADYTFWEIRDKESLKNDQDILALLATISNSVKK